jgi:putative ABC transport system substrate-binding protein
MLGVLAVPLPGAGQRATTAARVGYLTPSAQPGRDDAFRQEMHRLGYADLVLEYRSADGRFDRLPALAAELVRLKVDVIVAVVTQAAVAAKQATDTIPIVMVAVSDPVAAGLVASLGRPGRNVTGTSGQAAHVAAKQVELLHELLPRAARIAALWNPANPVFQKDQLRQVTTAAAKLKLQLTQVEARTPAEIDAAFGTIAEQRPHGLILLADPVFGTHIARIADHALKLRLPAVSGGSDYADAGILMTYGPSYAAMHRRAATYVDRILKGAAPSDLPIEQPTTFELAVNRRSARALGMTLPPALLVRADRLID